MTKLASDSLIANHNIYVQAINYPTVARGEERLRFTVTPGHTQEQMDHLISSVDQVFTELNIKRVKDWEAEGGRAGVGMPNAKPIEPIWNDKQLGLLDGTTVSSSASRCLSPRPSADLFNFRLLDIGHANQKPCLVFKFLNTNLKRYMDFGNQNRVPIPLDMVKVRFALFVASSVIAYADGYRSCD